MSSFKGAYGVDFIRCEFECLFPGGDVSGELVFSGTCKNLLEKGRGRQMQQMDQVMAGYKGGSFKGGPELGVILPGQFPHKLLELASPCMFRGLFSSRVSQGKQENVLGVRMCFHEESGYASLGQDSFVSGLKQEQRSEMILNHLFGMSCLSAGKPEPVANFGHHPGSNRRVACKCDRTIPGCLSGHGLAYVVQQGRQFQAGSSTLVLGLGHWQWVCVRGLILSGQTLHVTNCLNGVVKNIKCVVSVLDAVFHGCHFRQDSEQNPAIGHFLQPYMGA